jgi:Zn finger protein HypA/HybF involved in hydrogenase expression
VREAHESGLHAWYCLNCKGFYKGEINNAKCPKCGNIGKRICRPKCRGKLDILGVDLSLIDKEVKLEIIDDTENQEKPF